MNSLVTRIRPLMRLMCLWILLFTGVNISHAETMSYVSSYGSFERGALAQWVQSKAQKPISLERSRKYVDQAYLHGFAKELDPLVVLAMMKVESGFMERAKSVVGAVGLLQVWPKWHKDKLGGRDPYNPNVSIEVGSAILKDCMVRWKKPLSKVFACYSGGAKNYERKVRAEHKELASLVKVAQLMAQTQGSIEEPVEILEVNTPKEITYNTASIVALDTRNITNKEAVFVALFNNHDSYQTQGVMDSSNTKAQVFDRVVYTNDLQQ